MTELGLLTTQTQNELTAATDRVSSVGSAVDRLEIKAGHLDKAAAAADNRAASLRTELGEVFLSNQPPAQ